MVDIRENRRCREYCPLCGQVMFEFYRSPDGHFGIVNRPIGRDSQRDAGAEIACPTCGAVYILLDRLDAQGHPVRKARGRPVTRRVGRNPVKRGKG